MWMLLLLLIPTLSFAQAPFDPLPTNETGPISGVTVYHPAPGVESYWDNHGNSTMVYEQTPGMSGYTSRNRDGQVTKQGYLFDPMGPSTPLRIDPPTPEQRMMDRWNGR
jgi:hypothetical protein